MLFGIILFTAPFLVHVNGFVDTPADPVVLKTLNTHGDRISDLELIVKRLLASNQDLQKAVTALQAENTALKAAMQVNSSNCCCTSQVSCQQPQNTSTPPPVTKTSSTVLHQTTTSSTPTTSPTSHQPMASQTASTTTKVTTPGRAQQPVQCAVCSKAYPEVLCEKLYTIQTCNPPNNYCINQLTNNQYGARIVKRSCGNITTCQRDWYYHTSDRDVCTSFDANNIYTNYFQCTYCCTGDSCNVNVVPDRKTLYRGN